MSLVLENNFIELQRKTMHVLVEQKVLSSEQDNIDTFLDKVNEVKKDHIELFPEYKSVIEEVVLDIAKDLPKEKLISISESLKTLVSTTKRVVASLSDAKLKDCFLGEVKEYRLILSDVQEITYDVENRISGDSEMSDLLAEI